MIRTASFFCSLNPDFSSRFKVQIPRCRIQQAVFQDAINLKQAPLLAVKKYFSILKYSSLMSCKNAKLQSEFTLKRILLLIHQRKHNRNQNRTRDLEVFPGARYTIPSH